MTSRLGRISFEWGILAVALAALLAGLFFRFHHALVQPLWLDEAYSAFAADHDFGFLWTVVPQYETHPPLYYSVLRVWTLLVGNSLGALRTLGLLLGIATIPLMAVAASAAGRLADLTTSERRWLIATTLILVSLHPLTIAMSQQVRPYPAMIFVYAAGMVALLRLAADQKHGRAPSRRWLVAFFVAQALIMWLHDLGALFGMAMGLSLLAAVAGHKLTRRDWIWLIAGEMLVAAVYLPAFRMVLDQSTGWRNATWLRFSWADLPRDAGFIYITWNIWARLISLIAAIAGIILLSGRRGEARTATVLTLLAVVPTILSIALSATITPVFLDRTLSPVAVPGLLLIAAGLSWPGRARFLTIPAGIYLLISVCSVDLFVARQGPQQDWYAVVNWLAPRMGQGDILWAYPNDGALPLAYAMRDRSRQLPVRPIPAPVPALHSGGYNATGGRGTVSLYPSEIVTLMRQPTTQAPPIIWLMRLNANLYDPDDRMLHALEGRRTIIAHFTSGAIDITGLRRKDLPPFAPTEQAQP